MNKSEINLISTQKSNSIEVRRVLMLRWISITLLVSVAFFSILLFVLSSRISIENIKNQENNTLQKISLLKDRNAKYNLLADRLRIIKTLLISRKNYVGTLNLIVAQLPEGVNVRSLTLDKEGIVLSVSSNSLLPINQFLNNITENLSKKTVKDITIEGLTVDKQTQLYSLSLKAKSI